MKKKIARAAIKMLGGSIVLGSMVSCIFGMTIVGAKGITINGKDF